MTKNYGGCTTCRIRKKRCSLLDKPIGHSSLPSSHLGARAGQSDSQTACDDCDDCTRLKLQCIQRGPRIPPEYRSEFVIQAITKWGRSSKSRRGTETLSLDDVVALKQCSQHAAFSTLPSEMLESASSWYEHSQTSTGDFLAVPNAWGYASASVSPSGSSHWSPASANLSFSPHSLADVPAQPHSPAGSSGLPQLSFETPDFFGNASSLQAFGWAHVPATSDTLTFEVVGSTVDPSLIYPSRSNELRMTETVQQSTAPTLIGNVRAAPYAQDSYNQDSVVPPSNFPSTQPWDWSAGQGLMPEGPAEGMRSRNEHPLSRGRRTVPAVLHRSKDEVEASVEPLQRSMHALQLNNRGVSAAAVAARGNQRAHDGLLAQNTHIRTNNHTYHDTRLSHTGGATANSSRSYRAVQTTARSPLAPVFGGSRRNHNLATGASDATPVPRASTGVQPITSAQFGSGLRTTQPISPSTPGTSREGGSRSLERSAWEAGVPSLTFSGPSGGPIQSMRRVDPRPSSYLAAGATRAPAPFWPSQDGFHHHQY